MTGLARARQAISTLVLVTASAALLATCLLTGRAPLQLATVDSGSMAPALPAGSLVLLREEPVGQVRVGQVLSYRAPTPVHQVITHRVTAVHRSTSDTDGREVTIRTRGDANPGEDPWTATLAEPTAWRVAASTPHVGTLLAIARHAASSRVVLALGLAAALQLIWGPSPSRLVRRRCRRTTARAGSAALLVTALTVAAGSSADAVWRTSVSRGHSVATTRLLTPVLNSATGTCLLNAPAVKVAWTSPTDARAGVRLERRPGTSSTWTVVADLPAATTSYSDRAVAYANRYAYRVTHTRYAWAGAPSAEVLTASLAPCLAAAG